MKRYRFYNVGELTDMLEECDGKWVKYNDAVEEILRLQRELKELKDQQPGPSKGRLQWAVEKLLEEEGV